MSTAVSGFSKLSKHDKIEWLIQHYGSNPKQSRVVLAEFQHPDQAQQATLDGFAENAVANFALPYCIAPNFKINGQLYAVPMVIEESSVVAAASSAAKFWMDYGGFFTKIIGTVKLGQIHFRWFGSPEAIKQLFPLMEAHLRQACAALTANMEQRGGGLMGMELIDFSAEEAGYYQLRLSFETCNSMGANFINSVLECCADALEHFFTSHPELSDADRDVEVLMSILSNYTPECLVHAWVEAPVESFAEAASVYGMNAGQMADRFAMAVRIAQLDPYRATTHNKGIFNGIDAVVIATGNDFRAIEACGHTYAARDGQYRSLSHCSIQDGIFRFELTIPLALGTVGGLTNLHPLAKQSLDILGNPSASELMSIVAAVGLAQNFAAVRSLVTSGIQQGHMKMHLSNIFRHLNATEAEIAAGQSHFLGKTISFSAVRAFLTAFRASHALID
jgi:hydroxymethylglutaryl-CoA reductase